MEILEVDPIRAVDEESLKKKMKWKDQSSALAEEKHDSPLASLYKVTTVGIKLDMTKDIRMPFRIKSNRSGVNEAASEIQGLRLGMALAWTKKIFYPPNVAVPIAINLVTEVSCFALFSRFSSELLG